MTEPEALARDDAGIKIAAIALCWAARPVLVTPGLPDADDALSWWLMQSEMDQRLYLYRARVAVAAWEEYWQEIEEARGYDT